jgi:cyclic pyranopterin phosphate synthase
MKKIFFAKLDQFDVPDPVPFLVAGSPAVDQLGRPLKDLRISVIDQCNFRCTYCMPKETYTKDYRFLKADERLSFDQIVDMAKAFATLGVERIRITGGEPLLRKNLDRLIERLARITSLNGSPIQIALTTNGALLARQAQALKDAGLTRVTVSLDALDDKVFRSMNDVDFPVHEVLRGIEAAHRVGLAPLKINTVIKRGVNGHEILPLASHFKGTGIVLRFIEFMDVGGPNSWSGEGVMPSAEVHDLIDSRFPLLPATQQRSSDTARMWRYADGSGEVGFISAVSDPFCGDCTRARISADGKLYLCLFATRGYDLKKSITAAGSTDELASVFRQIWAAREDRYSELREATILSKSRVDAGKVGMSFVGG